MHQFAGHFLAPPLPLIGLLAIGLLLGSARRTGRALMAVGTLGLLLCSVPLTGKLLAYPLLRFEHAALSPPAGGAAILVPTAGAFNDEAGNWWPSRQTIQRVAKAEALRRLDLPLLITGGSPGGEGPSEAAVAMRRLRLDPKTWLVDPTARNTYENAAAARRILAPKGIGTVLLVTHEAHMTRMAATLRHQGFAVLPVVAGEPRLSTFEWADLMPSNAGFSYSATAVKMYGGILLYLVRGWIDVSDLVAPAR